MVSLGGMAGHHQTLTDGQTATHNTAAAGGCRTALFVALSSASEGKSGMVPHDLRHSSSGMLEAQAGHRGQDTSRRLPRTLPHLQGAALKLTPNAGASPGAPEHVADGQPQRPPNAALNWRKRINRLYQAAALQAAWRWASQLPASGLAPVPRQLRACLEHAIPGTRLPCLQLESAECRACSRTSGPSRRHT